MYKPDGIPDLIQQIKHGTINLLSGYRAAGHTFTGIIANLEGSYITGDWLPILISYFMIPGLDQGKGRLLIPELRMTGGYSQTGIQVWNIR